MIIDPLIKSLLENGITVTIEPSKRVYFEDGFYKSDGFSYLESSNGDWILHGRYDESHVVAGLGDIVLNSYEWWEHSRDRFDGWAEPPLHWKKLYKQYGLA